MFLGHLLAGVGRLQFVGLKFAPIVTFHHHFKEKNNFPRKNNRALGSVVPLITHQVDFCCNKI
jgi:hypothetical protein